MMRRIDELAPQIIFPKQLLKSPLAQNKFIRDKNQT